MSGIYQAPPGWVGTLCTYTRPADSHIATITYNRPEAANAINLEMREDINCKYRYRTE
jgi:enoyl-CoA hydratase/carnithine racemase